MFEANIWFWLFLLGAGPSKEELAAEIREGIEAERIANDPVHRARRAREEAQRKANEKAQRKANEEAQRIANEEAQRIANDPVRIAQQEAAAVALASEFNRVLKVVFWSFFFLILVYVSLMWLVVPMVDGPKRKADAAQRSADEEAQRIANDPARRKADAAQRKADEEARRIADGNGQIGIRMSQSQRRADAAQSTAVEAHSDGNGQIGIRMSQSQGRASEAQRKADEAKQKQSP